MNDWIIRKDKDKSSIHTDHIIHWLTKRQTNSLIFQYFRNAVSHHWTLLSSVTEKVILISTFKRHDYHTHAHRGVANRGCRPTLFFDWLIHKLGFRVLQNKKKKTTTTKQLPNPSIAPLIGLHVCEPFSFLLLPLLHWPIFRLHCWFRRGLGRYLPVSGGLSAFPRLSLEVSAGMSHYRPKFSWSRLPKCLIMRCCDFGYVEHEIYLFIYFKAISVVK